MLIRDDVLKVSKLAKIKLTEEEISKFTPQLSEIINYVDMLSKVDTSNVEPFLHTNQDVSNRFHSDDIEKSLELDDILKNAQRKTGRHIVTDAVL